MKIENSSIFELKNFFQMSLMLIDFSQDFPLLLHHLTWFISEESVTIVRIVRPCERKFMTCVSDSVNQIPSPPYNLSSVVKLSIFILFPFIIVNRPKRRKEDFIVIFNDSENIFIV